MILSDSLLIRFWAYVDVRGKNECWPWTGSRMTHGGYGQINERGAVIKAHRLSLFLKQGKLNPKSQVCHKCNYPPCVNPKHLYEGNYLTNTRDKIKAGTQYLIPPQLGEINYQTTLTNQDVLEIRSSKESGASLARKFKMSKSAISCIKRRKSWKHI
jgi:hypothetical protein